MQKARRMDDDMSAEFDLHALDKKDIREQVFDQLLSQITTGKWKPGEKIPSENELTSIMGVSRISVREAIQKLAAMDLVETYRGKGTFVKEFTTNNYLKSLTPMLLMTPGDILFVVEYRRILEVGIIDLYTRNTTERDIVFLSRTLDKMKQYYRTNLKKYTKYDLEFHMKLYEMTGNPFIIKISNLIYDILSAAMKEAVTERGAEEGIDFHSKMLEYIKTGDVPKLKKLNNELFDQIELEVRENMVHDEA
jgi:GntR family transcriptional repressor for pyruvate dehydrogenase complex